MEMSPYCPPVRSSSCRALVTRMQPVAPSGCPSAMAPPLGYPVMSASAALDPGTTEAKASLTSKTSMSLMLKPVCFSIFSVAGMGPSSIIWVTAHKRRCSNFSHWGEPKFCGFAALIISTAPAPSAICDRLVQRYEHRLLALRSLSRPASFNLSRPSSLVTRSMLSVRSKSSSISGASISMIWLSKWPPSIAALANVCERLRYQHHDR